MGSVIVIGGGPSGLFTAMLLSKRGFEVTILEKDRAVVPASAAAAWDTWERHGVAQFRQAHTLLPMGRELLTEHAPGVLDRLVEAGAVDFSGLDALPPSITDRSPRPGDERYRSLGARRPVYEMAFSAEADTAGGVTIRRGVAAASLVTGPSVIPGVRHVTGVQTDDGELLTADVIIDAAGRRSAVPRLLKQAGALSPVESAVDSRFVYSTRFYRASSPEAVPKPFVPDLVAAGSISLLILPGDNETWSMTLYSTTADRAMRAVKDPSVFDQVVRAHPQHAKWIDAEALTDVKVMAGVLDRQRDFERDGQPVATGILAVGDAWACTNPSLGRGITMALMHVVETVDAVTENVDDPAAMFEAWATASREKLEPWHAATGVLDRARIKEMEAYRAGWDGRPDPTDTAAMEQQAYVTAVMTDPVVFRANLDLVGCLALPGEVFARPEIGARIAAAATNELPPMPTMPSRTELEQILA